MTFPGVTEPCKQCHPELHRSQCWEGGCIAATEFQPCAEAPIGIVTNCDAMDCEGQGCAVAAPQVPVSLDDLVVRLRCTCPVGSDAIGPHTSGCPNHPEYGR